MEWFFTENGVSHAAIGLTCQELNLLGVGCLVAKYFSYWKPALRLHANDQLGGGADFQIGAEITANHCALWSDEEVSRIE